MNIDQIISSGKMFEFKEAQINSLFAGKEAVVLYFSELGATNKGKIFVNKLRKKNIFNEALILPIYTFMNKRMPVQDYIKEFKELNPNVRVVPQFKSFIKGKINFIDLTVLSELYFIMTRSLSKFKVTEELINIFNQFIEEYKGENKEFYLIIDAGRNEIDNIFTELLFKIARKKGLKFKSDFLKINGAVINKFDEESQQFKFFPLLEKKGNDLLFKLNGYTQFQKDYKTGFKDEEIEDLDNINEKGEISKEKEFENLRKEVLNISDKLLKKKIDLEAINTGEQQEALDNLYEVLHNSDLEGDTPTEKIHNLFKDQKDKKAQERVKSIIEYLEKVNKKFNGAIELNYKLINDLNDNYFDPEKIIKLKELTGYKKHDQEFDEILDHSMFDLIKSIEKDKEAGVKVLDIKTEIYDTNKSRYKKYIITFKNSDTENRKAYSREIVVPYPIKGKYFKIDGVNYIMLNQFYPKPILKVKPNMVRLYTHFSTFTVWLTTHVIDETKDIGEFTNILIKLNKKAKVDYIDESTLNDNISEFGLENINKELINRKLEF